MHSRSFPVTEGSGVRTTAFVLVPGAGGQASYWDETAAELRSRGFDARPVDIREDDPALGLPEYAEITEAAFPDHDDVVLVAQSLGGFTAPMVRRPVRAIVLLNAMVPLPGETPGAWWGNVGAVEARLENDRAAGRSTDFDLHTHFLHDIPEEVVARMMAGGSRDPSDTPFAQPCAFDRWPEVPITVLVGDGDRFFPPALQQRVARERLGVEPELLRGGHLIAKSNPVGVAERLAAAAGAAQGASTDEMR